MSGRKIITAISWISFILACLVPTVQGQDEQWQPPVRISSEDKLASESVVVADAYGYVHAMWIETGFDEGRSLIQYARYDGDSWSVPVDIYLSGPNASLSYLSLAVDQHNTLHLVWSVGFRVGPAFYMQAPAHDAMSAKHWSEPVRIDIPAHLLHLQVDSKGVLHIVYSKFFQPDIGVYYIRSEDDGKTWSIPRWLDPDIPVSYRVGSLEFERDEVDDGLHMVWLYSETTAGEDEFGNETTVELNVELNYMHSLDGGSSWSSPFAIDEDKEKTGKMRAASPIMSADDRAVHVVWAAGDLNYRNHRFSIDGGRTWSAPSRIFGHLNGQAFDALTVDSAGRVHFFGQIRFPQGIYHAYWEQSRWTTPSIIYFIRYSADETIGDRIHAHYMRSTVRAGNELVVTFTDNPTHATRGLHTMQYTLSDLSPLFVAPLPTPILLIPTPTPMPLVLTPEVTAAPAIVMNSTSPPPNASTPISAVWLGLIPVLLLVGGAIVTQLLRKS